MLQIVIKGLYKTAPKSFEYLAALNPEIGIEQLARLLDERLRKRTVGTRMVGEVVCYFLLGEVNEDIVPPPEENLTIDLRITPIRLRRSF